MCGGYYFFYYECEWMADVALWVLWEVGFGGFLVAGGAIELKKVDLFELLSWAAKDSGVQALDFEGFEFELPDSD